MNFYKAILACGVFALSACAATGENQETATMTENSTSQPAPRSAVAAAPSTASVADATLGADTAAATPAAAEAAATDPVVEIKTTMGDITIRLYNDTPRHTANFLKLAREGYYDGVLFHRVINDFMVQTGDPASKNAPAGKMLGEGDPGYTIEAEFVYPKHFHKRGALAAARTGDNVNPERRSSGSQFYIVTGRVLNEQQLRQMEQQLQMAQQQDIFNRLASERRDEIMEMRRNRDTVGLQNLQEQLIAITESEAAKNPARLTDEQRQAYSTIGGTPHLDGQYTVFGEVISGMDVVDRIQKAETDRNDRPVEDIKIISMHVVGD